MNIEVNVEDRVLRPVSEVFAAIVDPEKMSHYFISRGSAPMKTGAKIEWEFADVGSTASIEVIEVEENRTIVYEWEAAGGGKARVTMRLEGVDSGITLVRINEAAFPMDREGVQRAMGQTAGWTHFLCCLKAYLQFGINLRVGVARSLTPSAA